MAIKLMYITNDEHIAKIADYHGVDWIFIDLEINGKVERQGHLDTVISHHSINDVKKIKAILKQSKLLVRVNPIYDGSKEEIDKVIQDGADVVMLPYFKKKEEVILFLRHVNGRVKSCLLLETPEAVDNLNSILSVDGIDYIHIGLNDLHLGYKMSFMFELLADGTVEKLCNKIKEKGIPYGFGGIARLGQGDLPAENIIAEHYRLGSSMVILARSFYKSNKDDDSKAIEKVFNEELKKIRDYESNLKNMDQTFFEWNRNEVMNKTLAIKNNKVGLHEKVINSRTH